MMSEVHAHGEGGELIGGRYRLLGLLGAGAMGSVYRARDQELDLLVAVKMLKRELTTHSDALERFRREVRLARRVTHRNVARTYDIGEHHGARFLTMELLDGQSLGRRLSKDGPPPLAEAVAWLGEICAGLQAAHEAGVVHRDLKPDNIYLCSDGRVVITDFGIARALFDDPAAAKQTAAMLGSPGYMAPEQIDQSAPVDARTDIYALGALMYELFTGELPWTGQSLQQLLLARLFQEPPDPRKRRPDLSDTVAEVTLRCMAREPAARFQSAQAVAEALSRVTVPLAVEALLPVPPAAPAPRPSAPPVLPAGAGATVVDDAGSLIGASGPVVGTGYGQKTVAVLPLRNGGPPDDQYLADGLTEDLIDNLSMTAGLRVRPRGVVMPYAGSPRDALELGRELSVQCVVEGSLRRAGERVRVQVRVLCVGEAVQLFARRLERPAGEVLSISDELAQAVAEVLTVGQPQARREPLSDPVAVDLYLQARHAYHQPDAVHTQRSAGLFEEALRRAPEDPLILSGYALARARQWFFGGEGARELARSAAERALKQAPERGESHLAQGVVLYQGGDAAGAVRCLREAIRRAPALADAYDLLGRILVETGPLREGMGYVRNALLLDGQLGVARLTLARAHALLGEWEQAHKELAAMLVPGKEAEVAAGYWMVRARLILWRRDRAAAEELLRHPLIQDGPFPIVREVLRVLTESEGALGSFPHTAGSSERNRAFALQTMVEAACLRGLWAEAFQMLAQFRDVPLIDLSWLELCPLLAPLRADPRFEEVRRVVERRAGAVRQALRA